jgi:hypothetical protein
MSERLWKWLSHMVRTEVDRLDRDALTQSLHMHAWPPLARLTRSLVQSGDGPRWTKSPYIYISNSHPITKSGNVRQDWSGRNGKRHDDTATWGLLYIYIYLSNSHPITNSGTVRQDWSGRNGKRHDDTATWGGLLQCLQEEVDGAWKQHGRRHSRRGRSAHCSTCLRLRSTRICLSLPAPGLSEASKNRTLLCLVARGEAGVVEMGASEVRKKCALFCLVAGGEAGVLEMERLHQG